MGDDVLVALGIAKDVALRMGSLTDGKKPVCELKIRLKNSTLVRRKGAEGRKS